MKTLVYAIFDSKVGVYAQPFFMRTRGEAIRAFETLANDRNSQLNKYPGDFSLFELGEYEDEEGTFKNRTAGLNLGLAQAYISNHNNQMEQMVEKITQEVKPKPETLKAAN
jgi:hypothetical protein